MTTNSKHVEAGKKTRHRRLSESDAVLKMHLDRRTKKPITLDQLKTYRATIAPQRFKQLNVDETYQRVRIAHWVNDLIHTIKAGGWVPDPIALAERPDGSLWIVDGQQRYWAASECGVPLEAIIYKVPDPKTDNYVTERKLFYVLSRTYGLTTVNRVATWAGRVTELLHQVDESDAYTTHHIGFKHGGGTVYNPSVIVCGIVTLLSSAVARGSLDSVLRRSETLLETVAARQRATAFIALIPRVWPHPPDARRLAVLGLARVARLRWADRITDVTPTVASRVGRVNVSLLTNGSISLRFLPLVEGAYAKRWPSR